MTMPGARETVNTLILGYAAPARAEWHERMVWLIAWFVAALPVLRFIPQTIDFMQNAPSLDLVLRNENLEGQAYYFLSLVVEPCAGILVAISALHCIYRRRIEASTIAAMIAYVVICAFEALLKPDWYRGGYLGPMDYLFEQVSGLALVAFPMLLLLLLRPASMRPAVSVARRILLLLVFSCAAGAAATAHYWATTPNAWNGLIMDFWEFLDGHFQPTAKCLGQLMLNVGVLVLIFLLAQSLFVRRCSPTLLRAMTSLLFVGWSIRLVEGIAWRIYGLFTPATWWHETTGYGGANGLFAFPDVADYESKIQQADDALNFCSTALIALIFVICLRIAINRPEVLARCTKPKATT